MLGKLRQRINVCENFFAELPGVDQGIIPAESLVSQTVKPIGKVVVCAPARLLRCYVNKTGYGSVLSQSPGNYSAVLIAH